jgi:geranylgeranyl diphosphate synthase type I
MTTETTHPVDAPQGSFRPLLADFRQKLEAELSCWLQEKDRQAVAESGASRELTEVLTRFVARDGKRIRPALLYYTYGACGGLSDDQVMPMAMSVELLHTYLLIHDDIMDHADVRRGEPAAHVMYAQLHRERGWQGSSEHFGESVAILLGDLAQTYSLELYSSVDLAPEVAGEFRQQFSMMCQEVVLGQYLEMTAGNREHLEEDELLRVLRMKSGRYSVERPVQLGYLLARAPGATRQALTTYGLKMGEAFQLQDDLLGMFGDAKTVGKPVGADLVEGKFTLLIHHAMRHLPEADRKDLQRALGNADLESDEIVRVQGMIEASGARRKVQEMVEERLDQAREALGTVRLAEDGAAFLEGLIEYLRGRKR